MKTFAIHTLGCKTNQLESATISETLVDEGYIPVDFAEVADFYIVNTCSVTAKSDTESAYYIRKAKHTNPDAKIIVTGCYAQLKPEDIDADVIIGNADKLDLVNYIKSNTVLVSDIMQEREFRDKKVLTAEGRTRANIKIQDGCNNRCSYCIIPYARGKSRSNSLENILEQVKLYAQKGYKEVVVTGIHIGQWGLDLPEKKTFLDLLIAIENLDCNCRIRLGSLDPNELEPDVVDFLAKSKKIAHHIHISLQNANDEILKLMRRSYDVASVKNIMAALKSKIPDISLGCDVIVGFPTETESQFEDCYQNLSVMPFSYMHVFPYSVRPGTPAAAMEQVQDGKKTNRAKRLRDLAKAKKQTFIDSLVGQNLEVLVENKRDNSGKLKGVSSNYLKVLFDGDDSLQNQICQVTVVGNADGMVLGEISSNLVSLPFNES